MAEEEYHIHFEVVVTDEPLFRPNSADPAEVPEMHMVACHVVQVLEETEESLVCCGSMRFLDGEVLSTSSNIIIPKSTISHRAKLEIGEDQPEVPLVESDDDDDEFEPDIPEGVDDTLYPMTPEERRYRGYE